MHRDDLRRVIAASICRWRRKSGLALEAVGQSVGVSVRTVQRWESGMTEPNATDLYLMEQLRPGLVASIFPM